jgi:hypothetical protein
VYANEPRDQEGSRWTIRRPSAIIIFVAVIRLRVVKGDIEAELLCGLLRDAGIQCASTISADEGFEGFSANAMHDVFVDDADADRAREVVEDLEARRVTDDTAKRRLLHVLDGVGLLWSAFRAREVTRSLSFKRLRRRTSERFPLPPARLRVRVAGTADPDWFVEGGRLSAETVRATS